MAEGVRLLEEAAAGDYLPRAVFFTPTEISERGRNLVTRYQQLRVETTAISAKEASRLSDAQSSQGMIGLFDTKPQSLEEQLRLEHRRILVCDRIGDPGNLGTLLRAAVAFGFGAVLATDGTAEMENPKTIRASAGAFFRVPMVSGLSGENIGSRLRGMNYTLLVADPQGVALNESLAATARLVVVIGSEAAGTDQQLAAMAHHKIRIPTTDLVESLNAAMAGSILMQRLGSIERNV